MYKYVNIRIYIYTIKLLALCCILYIYVLIYVLSIYISFPLSLFQAKISVKDPEVKMYIVKTLTV